MHFLFVGFLIVLSIQLIFFFLFIYGLTTKRKDLHPETTEPVSVVVCAHDEEENLKELIPLLLAQDHPQFEVLIVNDRSNDGTYDLLLEETKKDARLRMVHVNQVPPHADGKKYGITLAIKAAKYEIIALTDADCRPNSTLWIQSVSKNFDTATNMLLGYSPYNKVKGLLNAFIRYETLITASQYIAFALLGMPYMGVGRNMAYRKSLFLQHKGFKDIINVRGGDDDLFVNRHATKESVRVLLGSETMVYSKPKTTWREFFYQKVRHLSVGKKYRLEHLITVGMFNGSLLLTWMFGIVLLFFFDESIWVISALTVRSLILIYIIWVACKKLGHKFELWAAPFLDILYVFYYLSTGTMALVTNKVRWRT